METAISAVVVIAYVVLLTFVALRARTSHDFEDFSIANRSLPLALVFGCLAATYVGPGFTIGFVGKGYNSGFLFVGIALAYAIQNIFVGLVVAPKLRALNNCYTLGDAIGQKYGKNCQVIAGIISVGLCAGFSAVMAKAGGDIINNIFNLPREYSWLSVAIIVVFTALYTTFGGLRASVITDAFQFASFAIFLPVTLLLTFYFHLHGDMSIFYNQAYEATAEGIKSTSFIKIIGLVTAFLLGETLIPPYANMTLASKTTSISRNGFVLAGIFSIFWFTVMVSLGIMARSIIPEDTLEDHELYKLVEIVMPHSGYALLLVVLISVVMSSLDSLLNAGAVCFTQDIVKSFVPLKNGTALNIGRVTTVVIAIVAAVCALFVQNIINGLLTCYAVWTPAILPALIIGLWIKKPKPLAGILSMSVGSAVSVTLWIIFIFILKQSVDLSLPSVIIPGLAFSILAYFIGHLWKTSKSGA
ncbi:MAG: sodium:solute symporter family protein [Sedimentisphaerales bacterium]|nr:sodium:solute symporter family protein [Sedimentisphaerales bacterium]